MTHRVVQRQRAVAQFGNIAWCVTRTLMTQEACVERAATCNATPKQLVLPLFLSLAIWIASGHSSAQNAERSGKEVVDALCIACHGTGANGAPKIGDKKAWSKL